MFNQSSIEGLALVNAIVLFGQFRGNLYQFEANQLEATLLKAGQDIANQSALYTFGFHDD